MSVPHSIRNRLDAPAQRLRRHVEKRAQDFHEMIPDKVLEDLETIPGVCIAKVGAVHDGRRWFGFGHDVDRPLFVLTAVGDRAELRRIAGEGERVLRADLPGGVRYRLVVEPTPIAQGDRPVS
jgi:hypothetical protein